MKQKYRFNRAASARRCVPVCIKRMAALFLAIIFAFGFFPLTARADADPIKSVKLSVKSKLEPGQKLPEITIGGEAGERGVAVKASSSSYEVTAAEWVDNKSTRELVAAEEPKMKVTLTPTDVSADYFQASYKESSVSISGGSYVSARRDGDDLVVTLRVRGIKGDYDAPKDAWWNEDKLGEAKWEASDNDSGHYEVELLLDEKSIYKISETTAKKFNFYPYMTKEGEYMFRVRSIPWDDEQKKYGKKSEWAESSDLTISERYVSDGKGRAVEDASSTSTSLKQGTKEPVGWVKDEGGTWIYRYPSGDLSRGWEMLDGYWYYFNMDGAMQTGWQNIDGYYYYFYPDGTMALGWVKLDGKWYYMRPPGETDGPEGTMVAGPGWRIINTRYYYFNEDGSIYVGWLSENGKRYYLNELDNSLQGVLFTGWIQRDEKTWYASPNGEIVDGWWEIDGQWHYFYPESGEMAVNTSIDGFRINENGVMVQ